MASISRRQILTAGLANLSALAAGQLLLRADAKPTPESGSLGDYGKYIIDAQPGNTQKAMVGRGRKPQSQQSEPSAPWSATEDNILGPFYRQGAPFRAKITPPLEPGQVLLITGRLWALDTRKPLPDAVIDIWHASAKGRYDNDDPAKPPAKGVFLNRARLVTDENGQYEYETIHPGRYQIGPGVWRPSHIHYLVRCRGYKQLVTQLYFEGDPRNATDQFIKKSLIISLKNKSNANGSFETGTFDIVLAPERKAKGRDMMVRPVV